MADGDHAHEKPATAARIYDYHLGGTHNFPADRAAGQAVADRNPMVPLMARTNRAFLRRAVAHLTDIGVRQFLDIGSGIPTEGNVHEVAQQHAPDSRVAYVDIDAVAVMESLEILDGNKLTTAIRADLRDTKTILENPQFSELLDFHQPIALLLCAVLHFVPNDEEAMAAVMELRSALAPVATSSSAMPRHSRHRSSEPRSRTFKASTSSGPRRPSGSDLRKSWQHSSPAWKWSNRAWSGCRCGIRRPTTLRTSSTTRAAASESAASAARRRWPCG